MQKCIGEEDNDNWLVCSLDPNAAGKLGCALWLSLLWGDILSKRELFAAAIDNFLFKDNSLGIHSSILV